MSQHGVLPTSPPGVSGWCMCCRWPGIKAIKLYAWEEPYLSRISDLRETELRAIRRTQLLSMVRRQLFCVGLFNNRPTACVIDASACCISVFQHVL